MKKLTYNRMIIISIVCMLMGFILSEITGIKYFSNMGVCIVGLLYILNPVEPENYKDYPGMKKWIRIFGIVVFFLGLISRLNY